jgi:hypothetical protein
LTLGVRELHSTFTGDEASYILALGAARVAYEAGVVYNTDDINHRKVVNLEDTPTIDAAGNYLGSVYILNLMTLQDLEDSLRNTRELINDAILANRELLELRKQANDLQKYVNTIKLNRDNLEVQDLSLQSLYTVAQNNKLSYQAVDRILSLNPQIKNPTFAEGETKVIIPKVV